MRALNGKKGVFTSNTRKKRHISSILKSRRVSSIKRKTDIADCSLEIASEENIKLKDTVVERNPLMTEKEFYDKIDLSLKQVQEGKVTKLESLDDFDKIFGS